MKKIPLSDEGRRRLQHTNAYYSGGRLGAYTYNHVYGAAAAAAESFFVDQARAFGGPVLELGAGTGLISWPLAAAGFEVVAVDLASDMLELAAKKRRHFSAEIASRITFVRADMVDLALDRRFRTVMLPGRSFQHLTTPVEQRAALERIRDHLEPGGGAVITLFDPDLRYCDSAHEVVTIKSRNITKPPPRGSASGAVSSIVRPIRFGSC